MTPSTAFRRVVATCKRFGPGRLPGADRRTLGAGYAAATAAIGVATLYTALASALHLVGFASGFWAAVGLVALPFVVPSAFVAAVLTWRVMPADTTRFGLLAGLVGTALTYLVATALVYLVLVAVALLDGTGSEAGNAFVPGAVLEPAALVSLVAVFGVVFTGWLAFPVGCASGAMYERARQLQ